MAPPPAAEGAAAVAVVVRQRRRHAAWPPGGDVSITPPCILSIENHERNIQDGAPMTLPPGANAALRRRVAAGVEGRGDVVAGADHLGFGHVAALHHHSPIHAITDSLTDPVALCLERQCDRSPSDHRALRRGQRAAVAARDHPERVGVRECELVLHRAVRTVSTEDNAAALSHTAPRRAPNRRPTSAVRMKGLWR